MNPSEYEKQLLVSKILKLLDRNLLSNGQVKSLKVAIAEWYATHWRDDDSPKSEYRAAREIAYS